MTQQTMTITLPEDVFQRLHARSVRSKRPITEETVILLTSSLNADLVEPDIDELLAQLQHLTDAELWQAAAVKATAKEETQMQQLLDKQQRQGLTAEEVHEQQQLAIYFERIMLTRAQAAALLKQRGYDVTPLLN